MNKINFGGFDVFIAFIILFVVFTIVYWYVILYTPKKYTKGRYDELQNIRKAANNKNIKIKDHYKHIIGSFYIVRTQAGFKHALRCFTENNKEIEVKGYPTTFPSLICFSYEHNEKTIVKVNIVHFNKLLEHM